MIINITSLIDDNNVHTQMLVAACSFHLLLATCWHHRASIQWQGRPYTNISILLLMIGDGKLEILTIFRNI